MALKLFGTDGIRGVANTFPMTAEVAFRLAQALSKLVCQNVRRVAIGKDTRVSSYMLESALIAGFTSMGVDVIKMRVVPTPLITSQIADLNVDMGLMITASHNPYFDNGIKLIDRFGDKFSDEWTSKVEDLLTSDEKFVPSKDALGKVYKDKTSVLAYIQNVLRIAPNPDALQGLRIVLDCANGSFSKIMPQIFKNLGAGVITLSAEPDGYNINKDCGSQHTEHLSEVVVQSHAHLGIAVDGDGDRIIVVDNQGQRIDGDQIIAFLATYLYKHGNLKQNTVVATIWSNLGLEKYLHALGINFYRSLVGERYVIEKMRETGSNLGGEESGHMVLSDYSRTGDAMLAAIVVCLGIHESGKKVSEIFPVFRPFPTEAHNLRFDNKEIIGKILDNPEVKKCIDEVKECLNGHGSLIIRKSGTEPVIRLKIEDEDAAVAAAQVKIMLDCINKNA